MKKFITFCISLLAVSMSLSAQECRLELHNGQKMNGHVKAVTDTTLTIIMDNDATSTPVLIPANRIKSGRILPNGKLEINDGRITLLKDRKEVKARELNFDTSHPNYAIGKAMKISGATAIGIGVPCLAAGIATCIAGHVGESNSLNDLATFARCQQASYYLFGTGAALTIVGIPLYVGGKKIMNMSLNFTGTGAGLALNF